MNKDTIKIKQALEALRDAPYASPEAMVLAKTIIDKALAALSAEQQEEAQPLGWITEDYRIDKSATTYDPEVAERWRAKGWPVNPIYAGATPSDAQPQEQPNWQCVPTKPTPEMLLAIADYTNSGSNISAGLCYRAMLAAAPSASAAPVQPQEQPSMEAVRKAMQAYMECNSNEPFDRFAAALKAAAPVTVQPAKPEVIELAEKWERLAEKFYAAGTDISIAEGAQMKNCAKDLRALTRCATSKEATCTHDKQCWDCAGDPGIAVSKEASAPARDDVQKILEEYEIFKSNYEHDSLVQDMVRALQSHPAQAGKEASEAAQYPIGTIEVKSGECVKAWYDAALPDGFHKVYAAPVTVQPQEQRTTQEDLDAFILRAGFTYGWKNLESWARRMAEQAVEENQIGAYVLKFAKQLGWPNDGEGAFEYIQRKSYAQGFEDAAPVETVQPASKQAQAMEGLLKEARKIIKANETYRHMNKDWLQRAADVLKKGK